MNHDHYTYRVTWSPEDGEHVGLCAEIPVVELACAISGTGAGGNSTGGAQAVSRTAVADMRAAGEHVPEPLAERRYSGHFMVRVPPEVHRALALQAAEENVSLNRLASAKLAA